MPRRRRIPGSKPEIGIKRKRGLLVQAPCAGLPRPLVRACAHRHTSSRSVSTAWRGLAESEEGEGGDQFRGGRSLEDPRLESRAGGSLRGPRGSLAAKEGGTESQTAPLGRGRVGGRGEPLPRGHRTATGDCPRRGSQPPFCRPLGRADPRPPGCRDALTPPPPGPFPHEGRVPRAAACRVFGVNPPFHFPLPPAGG